MTCSSSVKDTEVGCGSASGSGSLSGHGGDFIEHTSIKALLGVGYCFGAGCGGGNPIFGGFGGGTSPSAGSYLATGAG